MVKFLKQAVDWVLEKEADAARGCHAKPEDIEKQIQVMENKKEVLEKQYIISIDNMVDAICCLSSWDVRHDVSFVLFRKI